MAAVPNKKIDDKTRDDRSTQFNKISTDGKSQMMNSEALFGRSDVQNYD